MLQGEHSATLEHSAILSTVIKLPFVIKIFVLSVFERPLNTSILYRTAHFVYFKGSPVEFFSNYDVFCPCLLFFGLNKKCRPRRYAALSHDVASRSDIMPCNKINKPLVVYRFGNVW